MKTCFLLVTWLTAKMDREKTACRGRKWACRCKYARECVLWSEEVGVCHVPLLPSGVFGPTCITQLYHRSSVDLTPCKSVFIKLSSEPNINLNVPGFWEYKYLTNTSRSYRVCILKRRTDLKRSDLSVIYDPLRQRCFHHPLLSYLPLNSPFPFSPPLSLLPPLPLLALLASIENQWGN